MSGTQTFPRVFGAFRGPTPIRLSGSTPFDALRDKAAETVSSNVPETLSDIPKHNRIEWLLTEQDEGFGMELTVSPKTPNSGEANWGIWGVFPASIVGTARPVDGGGVVFEGVATIPGYLIARWIAPIAAFACAVGLIFVAGGTTLDTTSRSGADVELIVATVTLLPIFAGVHVLVRMVSASPRGARALRVLAYVLHTDLESAE